MFRAQAERARQAFDEQDWRVPPSLEAARQDEPQQPDQRLQAELILPLGALIEDMREVFADHAEDIIRNGYEAALERLDANTTFNPDDPDVVATVARLNRQARGISQTTQSRINDAIRTGIAENESVADIQERVVAELRDMADGDRDPDSDTEQGRARRIASTTTTTAFERGQQRAFRDTNMYGMMWLSQRDVHVRSGHLAADGQQVQLGEPFRVAPTVGRGKEELEYPGDPSGRPSNIIDCRCTALPIPDAETYSKMQEEGDPDFSNLPQLSQSDG